MSLRFRKLSDYMTRREHGDLAQALSYAPEVLGRVRMQLVEHVGPMSLYVGIVRLACDTLPLIDLLIDTTDSELSTGAFAHLVFHPALRSVAKELAKDHRIGVRVNAH